MSRVASGTVPSSVSGVLDPPSIDERAYIYDRLTAAMDSHDLVDAHACLHRVLARIEQSLRQATTDIDYARLEPRLAPTVMTNVHTWASLALHASSVVMVDPDWRMRLGHAPAGSNAPVAGVLATLARIITLLRTPFTWASTWTPAWGSNLGADLGQGSLGPHHRRPTRQARQSSRCHQP